MISYAREIILIFCVLNVPVVLQTTIKPTTTTAKGITTTVNGQKAAVSSTTIGNSGSSTTSPPVVERCPVRTPVKNGRLVHSTNETSRQHIYGTTGTLICDNNFIPIGPLISTCINKSVWTEIGECVDKSKIKCQPIAEDKNGGKLTYTQSSGDLLGLGTVLKLTCRQNATATGTTELKCGTTGWEPSTGMGTCAENGMWNPTTLGTCSSSTTNNGGTTCPGAPLGGLGGMVTYTNNQFFGPFQAGTTSNLACSMGTTLSGSNSATCSNGLWNPTTLGSCNFGTSLGGTTGTGQCFSGVIAPSSTNTGLVSNCYTLPVPLFGTVTYSPPANPATPGDSKKEPCSIIKDLPHGVISYENNNLRVQDRVSHGTTAYLYCYFGTNPLGFQKTSCNDGNWKPLNIGNCVKEDEEQISLECGGCGASSWSYLPAPVSYRYSQPAPAQQQIETAPSQIQQEPEVVVVKKKIVYEDESSEEQPRYAKARRREYEEAPEERISTRTKYYDDSRESYKPRRRTIYRKIKKYLDSYENTESIRSTFMIQPQQTSQVHQLYNSYPGPSTAQFNPAPMQQLAPQYQQQTPTQAYPQAAPQQYQTQPPAQQYQPVQTPQQYQPVQTPQQYQPVQTPPQQYQPAQTPQQYQPNTPEQTPPEQQYQNDKITMMQQPNTQQQPNMQQPNQQQNTPFAHGKPNMEHVALDAPMAKNHNIFKARVHKK
uniref:Sushi domain-containing protein n=1 Tax=Rhabditophanes sp. KR3021 TaxID=114890 RepID=A0AC35TMT8_9BILA